MTDISIIVPVFNEEKRVEKAMRSLLKYRSSLAERGYVCQIVCVDDGSTDSSKSILKSMVENLTFITHKNNLGKGAAIKSALKKCSGRAIIIYDADAEYSTLDILKIVRPILANKADVVYGSRNTGIVNYNNQKSRYHYYIGGLILNGIVNLLFNIQTTDQTTCYKGFHRRFVNHLVQPIENRFSYEIAMTAIFSRYSDTILEIPIRYSPRKSSEGKKIKFRDFIQSVVTALYYRMHGYRRI